MVTETERPKTKPLIKRVSDLTKIVSEEDLLHAELKLAKLKAKVNTYEQNNKINFFVPWEHQDKCLTYIHDGKRIVLLQGSNRIGKTVLGAVVCGSYCLGVQPWDGKPTIFGDQPVRVRIICVDWEHHAKEVIVPSLKEWLPAGSFETKNNNVGIEAYWYFKNGSTIELLTHAQETKIHEGWKGHLVWADEPLPHDKFTANLRGLLDYKGTFLLTLTALYEPWILDEIALKNDPTIGRVLEIPMSANPNFTPEMISEFASDLPEEEKIARVTGGWLQLVGKIWKNYNPDVHVVDAFDVPPDWAVVGMIDFHLNTPQAIAFYAFDKRNMQWVIDEIWEHLSPEAIASQIIKRKKQNQWNLRSVFVDPLAKGDTAYVRNRGLEIEDTYSILEKALYPYGIQLHVASKDKASGIRNVDDRFRGMNNIPSLYIFRSCERHIWEIPRWVWKDGKPKDENDHMCENLYRSTLTGIKYIPPHIFERKIEYANKGKGVV